MERSRHQKGRKVNVTAGEYWGVLTDYMTGEKIRPATREEYERSERAGQSGDGTGVFTVDRDLDPCPADADPIVFGPVRLVYVREG
jgi:hypothetical protein